MRILTIADKECRALWDYYQPGTLKGVDLILSCGDLDPGYLEFLVTMTSCPVLYIHGNHDSRYQTNPPGGCTCIDGKLYNFNGLRILGLGGSMRYSAGKHQYTEKDIENIKAVYNLVKVRGFKLAAAKKMLRENKEGVDNNARVMEGLIKLREDLKELKRQLDYIN